MDATALLESETAAGPVAHRGEAPFEFCERACVARCRTHLGQQPGDADAIVFAREALTAGLDGEEMGDGLRERDQIGAVVDHDEPGRPQSGTGGRDVFVGQRGGEQRRFQHRVRRTRHRRDQCATDTWPTAEFFDDVPERRAHGELADTVALGVARDGAHDRAGGVSGADLAKPVGSVQDDAGHVRERLDVVDERR